METINISINFLANQNPETLQEETGHSVESWSGAHREISLHLMDSLENYLLCCYYYY